jgi:hypothetical protein
MRLAFMTAGGVLVLALVLHGPLLEHARSSPRMNHEARPLYHWA